MNDEQTRRAIDLASEGLPDWDDPPLQREREADRSPPADLAGDQPLAWAALESGASSFITGDAGTGKTYVLHRWIEAARARGLQVDVTAATGVAASLHDQGTSLHAYAGVPTQGDWREALAKRWWQLSARPRIASADCLVIDECSMLSARTLDAAECLVRVARARSVEDLARPWGGLQVVLVGDPGQLPPVDDQHGWPWESAAWRALQPIPIALRTVLRQRNDPVFAELLRDLRRGDCRSAHLEALLARLGEARPDAPRLLARRVEVKTANEAALAALTAAGRERLELQAVDGGRVPVPGDCPAPLELTLAIGARIMVTRNLYEPVAPCPGAMGCRVPGCKHGRNLLAANGALGRVLAWEPEAQVVRVGLDDGRELGLERYTWERTEWRLPSTPPPALTACPCGQPAEHRTSHGDHCAACYGRLARRKGERDTLWARGQFPLALAWAVTIHKSQGQSFDACSVGLGGTFAPGQGYVAVSRARSLEGLTVESLSGPGAFRAAAPVLAFERQGYRTDPGPLQPCDEADLRAARSSGGRGALRIPCAVRRVGRGYRLTCRECGRTAEGTSQGGAFAALRRGCAEKRSRYYYDEDGEE